MGNRIAVKDVDLSTVQVSKQANAQENESEDNDVDDDDGEGNDLNGATICKMKGKRRARSTDKASTRKEPATGGSLSNSMRERIARRRAAEDAEANLDVLVPPSEGHSDGTPAIDEVFMTIRDMV